MVPTESIHDILELMFDFEFDTGWIQIDAELREVRHWNCPYDAVRAIDQKISPINGETKEDDHTVAEAR